MECRRELLLVVPFIVVEALLSFVLLDIRRKSVAEAASLDVLLLSPLLVLSLLLTLSLTLSLLSLLMMLLLLLLMLLRV